MLLHGVALSRQDAGKVRRALFDGGAHDFRLEGVDDIFHVLYLSRHKGIESARSKVEEAYQHPTSFAKALPSSTHRCSCTESHCGGKMPAKSAWSSPEEMPASCPWRVAMVSVGNKSARMPFEKVGPHAVTSDTNLAI